MAQPNQSGLRSQLIISGAVVVGVYAVAGVGFAVVAALVAAAAIVIKHQAATPARRVAAAPRPPQRQRGGGQRRPKRGEFWYAALSSSQDETSSGMAPCLVVEVAGGSATVFPLTKEDQRRRPNFLPFRPPPGSKLEAGSLHTVPRTVELGRFGRWAETRCPPELRQEVDRLFPPGRR